MAINRQLFERLQAKLGVSSRRVYDLIDAKVRETPLSRELAAIALAGERGINIARFATKEELAEIRSARANVFPHVMPSSLPEPRRAAKPRKAATRRKPTRTVFVVHGRDSKARS